MNRKRQVFITVIDCERKREKESHKRPTNLNGSEWWIGLPHPFGNPDGPACDNEIEVSANTDERNDPKKELTPILVESIDKSVPGYGEEKESPSEDT
ncbi:hypothetical protein ACVWZX_002134 [Deinococcus sp. UYEF24]